MTKTFELTEQEAFERVLNLACPDLSEGARMNLVNALVAVRNNRNELQRALSACVRYRTPWPREMGPGEDEMVLWSDVQEALNEAAE